ncbi:MAG: type II toxin-antitoxin system prevent-host-death family antitoxin [Actinobacteria bacterium]|nr:type II toxin-antitoxin system prevent-host-death family antitoxin [Actinomycetota bacterium]
MATRPIGIRELRADLAAHVRRAANGEPTVVSVAGHPAAVLGPIAMSDEGRSAAHLSSLFASGGLTPPRRTDGRLPERTVGVWGNVRVDRLLREIRG